MTRNVLRKFGFTRTALAVGVGIPFMVAANAFAQAPDAAGQAEAERVIVTGSNIPTAEEVTASPLDTLTTADIARAGTSDVLTVLTKRNPDFVGAGNIGSTNANIASGNTLGGAIIQIRGLPTLVLLDSRRIADSAAIAVGGAQFTDVNLFPTALIGRIEVFKDGASAIYGSEAIGGVVNIFMKKDFTGVEVGYRYGFTPESAVTERRGYLIAGTGNETTHVTAAFQYYEIDPLFQRQRGYSSPPLSFQGGVTTTYGGSVRDADSRYLLNPGVASPFAVGAVPGGIALPPTPQYGSLPLAYSPASFGQVAAFDLSTKPTNTQKVSNTNTYGAFTHQIFGKQLEMFGDILYSRNQNESFLNAQPLSNGTGVLILGSMRVDPNTGALVPEDRGPPAPFNPFQLSLDSNTLAGPNRLIAGNRYQTNPRIFDDDSNFYRLLGGLRSQITDDWSVEGAAYYSHYGIDYVNSNLVNAQQLNAMIAGTAVDNNGNTIPAFDFFSVHPIGNGPGQVSSDQFNTIFGSNLRKLDSYQRSFDLRVVGFPFKLPGGPVGISIGTEFRIEGFKVKDSPEIFVGSVPIQQINRGRDINSFYGELSVPIVGPNMNVPFVYSLEANIAGRYDIYEGLSQDAKVPKYTLRYQPIKDLTLRATYSNSFVAPTLYELFGPIITGFSDVVDFGFGPEDQAQASSGSNPHLVPSTAESYTGGVVYSPSFVPGLTITADYFRTLQQQIVGTLGTNTILQSVEALGPASPYANLVAFNNFPNSPGARPVTAPGQLHGNLAAVFFNDNLINIGAQRVEGFDLSAHYNWDLRTFGQLELGVNAVVFTKQDLRTTPFTPYYNISGLVGSEFFGTNPDYKLTFLAEHRWQGFTLSLNANYIPELLNATGHDPETEDQSTFEPVKDYITLDSRLSYEFKRHSSAPPAAAESYSKDGKSVVAAKNVAGAEVGPSGEVMSAFDRVLDGLRLTVGCNNVFDEEPRFVRGANSTTNLATYDPYQRFVYFEVSKKF